MNFSYNWLSELVEGIDITPAELTSLITIKTAECEGTHAVAPWIGQVLAARVESVEPIEGSKNVKAVIDAGAAGKRTVVCGAPNCRAGMTTAYVPAGTMLGSKEIRKAVIAGVESEGMLASGAELGINREAEGILELSLQPGETLGLNADHIIEVDNKSLTHRPDLWGHHGMAREVAAILRKPLLDPVDLDLIPDAAPAIPVRIQDLDLCPRYSALVFENVTVQPSPLWLQYRLESIGLNPINNIVDVTNWIMAELAQPTHAFDAEKLNGGIVVRRANDGERLAALNHETYELNANHLVIADDAGPVALAGVIGGLASAISEATTRIVFESANFHAGSIRKTSTALKLRTDASMRFEKSQDPVNTVRALARAVQLLQEVSPGIRVVGGLADTSGARPAPAEIELPLEWLDRKVGRHVDTGEVKQILQALQFGVTETRPNVLSVSVPSWRATKDVSIKDDLVEEVGRMIGYASIPPTPPKLPASVPPQNLTRSYHHKIRGIVTGQGFHEVYNYSFVSEAKLRRFGLDPDEHVRVLNPIAADQTHLRTTLIPGIWANIVDNMRFFDDFRLFEIGVEIHKRDGELPNELNHLCAALYSKSGDTQGLFEMKRIAECLDRAVELRPAEARAWEHPVRAAEIHLHGHVIGRLFEMHPSFVERGRAALLDVDLDALMQLEKMDIRYQSIRRFPSTAFDLSVVAPQRALAGEIRAQMAGFATVDSIEYVRQYSGPPLPEGMKSVSYRVTVSAGDRTLSSEEAGAVRQQIIDGMQGLGYELRV